MAELVEIWRWNADRYGRAHADEYERFLRSGLGALGETHAGGRRIDGFPDLRSLTMRRRARGSGHVAVYTVDEGDEVVTVIHLFHTRMDLPTRLREG